MEVKAQTIRPQPVAFRNRFKRVRLALSLPAKALYSFGIRSTKKLHLPDFLIIGAPKAGTTWLAENLDAHPEVYLARRPGTSDPTELRYFNQGFRRPLTYYSGLFAPGADRIKGDKTPGYVKLSSFRIRFIRSILPDIRLIFFMRDPVERAWSHAVMNFVKLDGRKIEDVPQSQFYSWFRGAKEQGLYTEILDRWLSVFPEKQLYTGFYDDIPTEPVRVLREVCGHIGASDDVDWEEFPYRSVVNRGRGHGMPAAYREFLEDMYRDEKSALERRFGPLVSRWRAVARAAQHAAISALTLFLSFSDNYLDLFDLADLVDWVF